jgi:crotonobetainyl-CoA:carnitine CoA-transferase CaiB-like acyl-CoA transferase
MPGFDATPKRPAPMPGQHSRDVAAQLGYSQAEIDALFASRALRDNDQA